MTHSNLFYDNDEPSLELDDHIQRTQWQLPKGDVQFPAPDNRVLRPIIGFDVRQVQSPLIRQMDRDAIKLSRAWRHESGLIVSASINETRFGNLARIAVSYPNHDPTWTELKMLREMFFPMFVAVAMILPREEDYVNLHNHCYHLCQIPYAWNMM